MLIPGVGVSSTSLRIFSLPARSTYTPSCGGAVGSAAAGAFQAVRVDPSTTRLGSPRSTSGAAYGAYATAAAPRAISLTANCGCRGVVSLVCVPCWSEPSLELPVPVLPPVDPPELDDEEPPSNDDVPPPVLELEVLGSGV